MITITGTNFRQSKARPRLIRVPSASKVHLKTLILLRGKTPSYTYDLKINDSLSRRALKKTFEKYRSSPGNKSRYTFQRVVSPVIVCCIICLKEDMCMPLIN